ncbi:hypothetical protein Sjap_006994 [Stephania japonica]|uniref:Uncharacterized protein n=1 Tax=Stephania japonica TaxID=461633 RepID=A0AAP0K6V6_9MAGN
MLRLGVECSDVLHFVVLIVVNPAFESLVEISYLFAYTWGLANTIHLGFQRLFTSRLVEDMGTEYLVRPVGRAEDEEDASDFEPGEENGEEELGEEDDDDEGDTAGKGEVSAKRKRSSKDDSDDDDDDDSGEDDERPAKR